mmetsp:Transcript_28235/g.67822  ORF Transcript_28235/g.67822 Transcript_28235/m.67822 type:complete len:193 (-) Transcript_28235:130-708(-)
MTDIGKLHSTIRWGKYDEVKAMVPGEDPVVNEKDPGTGNTVIHISVQNGHQEITEYLASKKADLNAQNGKNNTALHMAVTYDMADSIKYLLDAKADPNLKNDDGHPAIAGLEGDKVGVKAWDGALTRLQAALGGDESAPIAQALADLKGAAEKDKESVPKGDLAKSVLMGKKGCKGWLPEHQAAFTEIMGLL